MSELRFRFRDVAALFPKGTRVVPLAFTRERKQAFVPAGVRLLVPGLGVVSFVANQWLTCIGLEDKLFFGKDLVVRYVECLPETDVLALEAADWNGVPPGRHMFADGRAVVVFEDFPE